MKKIISFALVAALVLSSASFAASKKAAPKKAAPAKKVAVSQRSGDMVVSPKISLYPGGNGSSISIGCEVSKPITDRVDFMGEVVYALPNGGLSDIVLGANAIYKLDKIKGLPGDLYAGGGLNYNILSGSGSSASGMGFQGLVGINIPAGDGIAFGQLKYVSYSYSVNVPFFGTVSTSVSGVVIEGGYRFAL